jgi:hypothetical protein
MLGIYVEPPQSTRRHMLQSNSLHFHSSENLKSSKSHRTRRRCFKAMQSFSDFQQDVVTLLIIWPNWENSVLFLFYKVQVNTFIDIPTRMLASVEQTRSHAHRQFFVREVLGRICNSNVDVKLLISRICIVYNCVGTEWWRFLDQREIK